MKDITWRGKKNKQKVSIKETKKINVTETWKGIYNTSQNKTRSQSRQVSTSPCVDTKAFALSWSRPLRWTLALALPLAECLTSKNTRGVRLARQGERGHRLLHSDTLTDTITCVIDRILTAACVIDRIQSSVSSATFRICYAWLVLFMHRYFALHF